MIKSPYMYIADPKKSGGIYGNAYFGVPDLDPTQPENQKLVKHIQENGSVVNLDQPVPLVAGVPSLNGSPMVLDVEGDYSFTINSQTGHVYHQDRIPGFVETVQSGVVVTESKTLANGQTTVVVTDVDVNASALYLHTKIGDQGFLFEGQDYDATNSTTIELTESHNAGDIVVFRQKDPTGQLISLSKGDGFSVFENMAAAVASAVAGDLSHGDNVAINQSNRLSDEHGGFFTVSNKSASYDPDPPIEESLTSTLMLKRAINYHTFKNYADTIVNTSSLSGVLTIDCNLGLVHAVTLSEHISSVVLTNVPTGSISIYATTIQILFTQSSGEPFRTVLYPGITSHAGIDHAMTASAGAKDKVSIVDYNGQQTLFILAQDDK